MQIDEHKTKQEISLQKKVTLHRNNVEKKGKWNWNFTNCDRKENIQRPMKKERFLKPQKTRAKGFDLLPWNYKQVGNYKLLSHLSFFTVCCAIFSRLA